MALLKQAFSTTKKELLQSPLRHPLDSLKIKSIFVGQP